MANPTNSDIWIPAKTRLGVISECDIEPKPTSEIEFIQTDDREQTIVPKDDVASVNGEAHFDVATLIPHDLECTETQRRKIVDLFTSHSDIFIQHDFDMGYTTTVTHKINTSDCKQTGGFHISTRNLRITFKAFWIRTSSQRTPARMLLLLSWFGRRMVP